MKRKWWIVVPLLTAVGVFLWLFYKPADLGGINKNAMLKDFASLKKVVYETGTDYLVRKELTEKRFDEIEKTINEKDLDITDFYYLLRTVFTDYPTISNIFKPSGVEEFGKYLPFKSYATGVFHDENIIKKNIELKKIITESNRPVSQVLTSEISNTHYSSGTADPKITSSFFKDTNTAYIKFNTFSAWSTKEDMEVDEFVKKQDSILIL